MTVSLLYIVVPTILVLAVLILYMNSRNRAIMKEIGELKTQLEKMDNVPDSRTHAAVQQEVHEQTQDMPEDVKGDSEVKGTGEKEEKDAVEDNITDIAASAYNTGKSGKIYTKEELELLIKE